MQGGVLVMAAGAAFGILVLLVPLLFTYLYGACSCLTRCSLFGITNQRCMVLPVINECGYRIPVNLVPAST